MIKITRFFYIHWLVFPLLFLAWLTGGLYTLLTAYAVVGIHELFHLFAALLLRERVGSLIIMPFGMTLRLSARIIRSTEKEILIALAGPLANILMLGIGRLLTYHYGDTSLSLLLFCFLNWAALAVNLLPCLPLDGGRAVKALLIKKMGYLSAASVMRRLSRIITVVLAVAGVVLLVITRLNISLLMAVGFLVLHMAEEQRQNEYVIMQELLYNKEKLRRRGAMRSRTISAMDNVRARDIFKMLGYDSYYIIFIVDGAQKPVRTVTEAQLVAAILQKGWHILLADI